MRFTKSILLTFALLTTLAATAFAADAAVALPAFPGAEGAGSTTPGGRGGKVYIVNTLADSGPGSFREACDAKEPRMVVFEVAGTISLKSKITIKNPFITIAGQTAPGGGICLSGYTLGIATHDVVIRHIRSRLGDETKQQDDCIDLLHGARNCIIDHCSATWSVDECLSLSGDVQDCTVQWCIIGESLRQSAHAKGSHGYGSLARASGMISLHHNLWIHNDSRNPRMGDNYGKGGAFPTFDVRNNVIYNYGSNASGQTQGKLKVNYVANYIRPGANSKKTTTPITVGPPSELQFFLRDNIFEGNDALTKDNSRFFNPATLQGKPAAQIMPEPFDMPAVTTLPAKDAMLLVLASAGASLPARDSVDARLVKNVISRTGAFINSQKEVGGWPELAAGTVREDTDRDGIPDEWELANKLNPNDATDSATISEASNSYTNLENYINSLK